MQRHGVKHNDRHADPRRPLQPSDTCIECEQTWNAIDGRAENLGGDRTAMFFGAPTTIFASTGMNADRVGVVERAAAGVLLGGTSSNVRTVGFPRTPRPVRGPDAILTLRSLVRDNGAEHLSSAFDEEGCLMRVRHVVAASVIAIVGILGSAGIAAAQTTPTPTGPNKQAACAKATARLPKIQDREAKVEARITKLQSRLATAQQNNHPDAVKVIQFRLDWLQKVDQHLKDTTNLINSECQSS
jgi:hypothetical protein